MAAPPELVLLEVSCLEVTSAMTEQTTSQPTLQPQKMLQCLLQHQSGVGGWGA